MSYIIASSPPEPPGTPGKHPVTPPRKLVEKGKRLLYGSVMIKPNSAAREFTKICEEIIDHFTSKLGTEVTITVEVQTESKEAFDEVTIRTVKENSRTLNFDQAEFEEE